MRKDWNPHDYIPWSDGKNYYALGGKDWDPEESKLSEVAQVAMLTNLLTEDNLPSYHREIAMNFCMDGPWGFWVNRWTAEENRHGIALRDYLVVTRAIDPVELEQLRIEQVTRGFSPGQNQQIEADLFADSLFDSVIYVTFQELATRVSHRNTGKACNEPIADQLLQRVSADENLHMIFYRDVSAAGFDIAPNQAMQLTAQGADQLQDARLHDPGLPAQGGHHRLRRRLRPTHPPRRRGDAGAQEVANLRARRLHRRSRPDARRTGCAHRGARGNLREVRDRQAAPARAHREGGREEGRQESSGGVISVLTDARPALQIGPIALRSPVVLAPMAGVTNVAFRTLCRELELARAGTVSGLYVCEMVTARALVERHPATMHMVTFADDETPRSLQLYSVDPREHVSPRRR